MAKFRLRKAVSEMKSKVNYAAVLGTNQVLLFRCKYEAAKKANSERRALYDCQLGQMKEINKDEKERSEQMVSRVRL